MSTSRLDLKPGDKVDKYEVLYELGSGGIATAYLAEQRWTKRKVVLKLFTPLPADVLAAIRRGTEIEASIDHPNITDLYDAGEHSGCLYKVIEFVDGGTLADMIKSEVEIPVAVVLKLMIDIADALDHIHSRGIAHGDVKPSNVLVSRAGIPVLTDLDLAAFSRLEPFQIQ